jgi:hypothetical protein
MSRRFLKTTALFFIAIAVTGTVSVFAASGSMTDGYAYNVVSHSGELKNCNAGTVNEAENEYASLQVTTTYTDGSTDCYASGIQFGAVEWNSGYEWSEDYSSFHGLYTTKSSSARATKRLSGN